MGEFIHTLREKSLDEWMKQFTVKPVTLAHALSAAHIFRRQASKGRADPIIAAQAVEGGYQMVTTNRQDFERVPGLNLVDL